MTINKDCAVSYSCQKYINSPANNKVERHFSLALAKQKKNTSFFAPTPNANETNDSILVRKSFGNFQEKKNSKKKYYLSTRQNIFVMLLLSHTNNEKHFTYRKKRRKEAHVVVCYVFLSSHDLMCAVLYIILLEIKLRSGIDGCGSVDILIFINILKKSKNI